MIYPSYGTLLHPTRHQEAVEILQVLRRLHFKNIPDKYCMLYADGVQHRVFSRTEEIPKDVDIIENSMFLTIYQQFEETLRDFLVNLQVGSKVIPDRRHLEGYDYPFTYSAEMENDYAGKEFTIQKIVPASEYHIRIDDKLAYNGDNRVFTLKGADVFMWHSSMFLMGSVTPIKKVELSSINIDLGF